MTDDTSPRLAVTRTEDTITLTITTPEGEPATVTLTPADAALAGSAMVAEAVGQVPGGTREFRGLPGPEEETSAPVPEPKSPAPVATPSIFAGRTRPAKPAPPRSPQAPVDVEDGEAVSSESPVSVPKEYEPLLSAEDPGEEWRVSLSATNRGKELNISEEQMLAAAKHPDRIEYPNADVVAHIRDGVSIIFPSDRQKVIIGAAWARDRVPDATTPRVPSGGPGKRMPSDYQELRALLLDHGFDVEMNSKHPKVSHPDHPGVTITAPGTASDFRSLRNLVARIRREFGVDITQSE